MPAGKRLPLGHCVRTVGLWGDPQDLAAQVVGVAGGALGVPGGAAGAFVDRGVAAGGERVGVVTDRRVEPAGGVHGQRTAHVRVGPALTPVGGDGQQPFLRGERDAVVGDREPGQVELFEGLVRPEQVDPAVAGEVAVQGHPEQPVGLVGHRRGVREVQQRGDLEGVGVDHLQRAGALDVVDLPVRADGQLEGVGQVLGDQPHPLEVAGLGGRAVTGDRAGRPLDAVAQVLQEGRAAELRAGVPTGGEPGPAAVVGLTPGVRVVDALVQAVDSVAHLDLGEGVHVAGRVGPPVVPLLALLPELRQVARGGVRPVEHLDPAGKGAAGGREVGVVVEDRADQALVPLPVTFAGRGGVQAGPTTAVADERLQRGPLAGVEQVTRGREAVGVVEHESVEGGEVGVGERRRVGGGDDLEVVGGAELLDRGDTGRNRVVVEVGDLGEDQHTEARGGLGGQGGGAAHHGGDGKQDQAERTEVSGHGGAPCRTVRGRKALSRCPHHGTDSQLRPSIAIW